MAHRHKMHHKAKGGGVGHTKEDRMTHDHEIEEEAHVKLGPAPKGHKHGGKVHGGKAHHRLDKRARGGGVGSDKNPFSSAHMGK